MVASAPSSCNVLKTCWLRPAATTRPAPRKLRLPLRPVRQSLPVAPRMRTFSPGASFARKVSKSQAETPRLCRAAAVSARRPANCSPCRHSRISRIGDVQREASTAPSPDGVPFVIAEHQRIASFHHFACENEICCVLFDLRPGESDFVALREAYPHVVEEGLRA